jgi:hypothetical protein
VTVVLAAPCQRAYGAQQQGLCRVGIKMSCCEDHAAVIGGNRRGQSPAQGTWGGEPARFKSPARHRHALCGWRDARIPLSMAPDSRGRRSPGLKRFWRDYNLSITLSALFRVSWGFQTWAGWVREEHQQIAELFSPSGYVFEWLSATMENWQSEFLQLLMFVVLTASFIHKGSHESKDSDEELKAMIRRIEERLAKIKS